MKKRYILIILYFLLFQAEEIKAQYVTLPDTNFRNYLIQNFPSCMNSNGQLDTVCASALNVTSMNVASTFNTIYDITGIQYFKKLDSLPLINSPGINLTSIPA